MNIQQNEEADSKLIGVENGDYGRSDANGLVHRTPSRMRASEAEINSFEWFNNRSRFCNKKQRSNYQII